METPLFITKCLCFSSCPLSDCWLNRALQLACAPAAFFADNSKLGGARFHNLWLSWSGSTNLLFRQHGEARPHRNLRRPSVSGQASKVSASHSSLGTGRHPIVLQGLLAITGKPISSSRENYRRVDIYMRRIKYGCFHPWICKKPFKTPSFPMALSRVRSSATWRIVEFFLRERVRPMAIDISPPRSSRPCLGSCSIDLLPTHSERH